MNIGHSKKEVLWFGPLGKGAQACLAAAAKQGNITAGKGKFLVGLQKGQLFFQPLGQGNIVVIHAGQILAGGLP